MGGFLRRRFPSGEAEDELTVVPGCVSLGARPQWPASEVYRFFGHPMER